MSVVDGSIFLTNSNSHGLRILAVPSGRTMNMIGGSGNNSVFTGIEGATIAGGGSSIGPHIVSGSFGTVSGGFQNSAAKDGTVAGGVDNQATGESATVSGGSENHASGVNATVPGGKLNVADGSFSFAAGVYATAKHDGTFVWSDGTHGPFESTSDSQFLIGAANGVGINTNHLDPTVAMLTVAGNVKADKFIGDGSLLTNLPSGGSGTITGVAAGFGLTGGGTSGNVTLGLTPCATGQLLKWNGSSWACSPDAGINGVTAVPGGGVFVGPPGPDGNPGITLVHDCASGQILKWSGTSWACAPDTGVTSVTSVGGGIFATPNPDGTVGIFLDHACAPGQILKFNGTSWACASDNMSIGIQGGGNEDTVPKFLAGGVTVGNSRISDNGADVKLGDDTSGRFSVLGNGTSPNIVGGHKDNSVSAGKVGGTIAGGGTSSAPNVVTDSFGSIGGGLANSAGNGGAVAGGNNNDVTGDYGAIGGGRDNRASGAFSTVPGGRQNIASGLTSFAAGFEAQAAHDGTFVWADQSAPGGFTSTDINQFLIRAQNGVGIGTSSPTQALDVVGNVKANGLCIGTDCRSTWPSGGGTITGVIPGAGLAGGGTSGSVSLSIPNGGITNAMLQSSVVTIGAGNGLTGGGIVALGGATNLAINTAVVPRLNVVNSFTAQQNITGSTSAGSGLLMATNSAFGGFGVIGSTSAATGAGGVRGDATATTGSTFGVEGQNFSSSGIGVYGLNTSTTGTNYGVKGTAASGGVGAAGVYGEETSPTGATYGVYGMSASSAGIGVFGTAPSTTGVGTGVLGTAAGTFGAYGVQGQATAATGTTFGGAFSSASNSGTGVYGFVTNTGGGFAGVWGAANSPGAIGGVFENNGGGDLIVARTSAGARFRVANNGNVTATGTFTGGGADFAESVDVLDSVAAYSPGDVLVVDPTSNRRFALSREPYSPLVAGIYSTKPGMLGSRSSMNDKQRADEIPMAVVGIVPTKVSAENGPIERGDLLVTSSTPGYAMKGTDRDRMLGAVVGKALEPLANGAGVIEVLVTVR